MCTLQQAKSSFFFGAERRTFWSPNILESSHLHTYVCGTASKGRSAAHGNEADTYELRGRGNGRVWPTTCSRQEKKKEEKKRRNIPSLPLATSPPFMTGTPSIAGRLDFVGLWPLVHQCTCASSSMAVHDGHWQRSCAPSIQHSSIPASRQTSGGSGVAGLFNGEGTFLIRSSRQFKVRYSPPKKNLVWYACSGRPGPLGTIASASVCILQQQPVNTQKKKNLRQKSALDPIRSSGYSRQLGLGRAKGNLPKCFSLHNLCFFFFLMGGRVVEPLPDTGERGAFSRFLMRQWDAQTQRPVLSCPVLSGQVRSGRLEVQELGGS